MSSWLLDLPAQRAFRDGTEVKPTVREWDFVGFDVTYDSTTGRLVIRRAGDYKESVRVATAAALPANTRSGNTLTADANGALPSVDGVALSVGDELLVKDEAASDLRHGAYVVDSLGGASSPWSMTRRADFDESSDITSGARFPVSEGTQAGQVWYLTTNDPITVNVTALSFSLFESISGSTGSTDNAIIRADGADSDTIQASGVTIDDSDAVAGVVSLSLGSTPATVGDVRMSGLFTFNARNDTNTADHGIFYLNVDESLEIGHDEGGVSLPGGVFLDATTAVRARISGTTKIDVTPSLVVINDPIEVSSTVAVADAGDVRLPDACKIAASAGGSGHITLVEKDATDIVTLGDRTAANRPAYTEMACTLEASMNVGGTSHFAVSTARINLGLPVMLSANGAYNVETISGSKTLDTTEPHFQKIDGGAADRNVDLVAESVGIDGFWFWIRNAGATNNLLVRDDTPTTLETLTPGDTCLVVCDGTAWISMGIF